jgi:hypothetical protein
MSIVFVVIENQKSVGAPASGDPERQGNQGHHQNRDRRG